MDNNSKELLSLFLSGLHEMAVVTDAKGAIIAANDAWHKHDKPEGVTGQAKENFIESVQAGEIVSTADCIAALADSFAAVASGKSVAEVRVCHQKNRSGANWVTVKITPITSGEKLLLLVRLETLHTHPIRGSTEDMVPQTLYKSLLDDLPILLNICDQHMRYVWVNRNFREQFELASDDVLGKMVADIPGLDQFDRLQLLRRRCFETGQEQSEIIRVKFKNRDMVLDARYIPVLEADGKVQYVIGANRDITRQEKSQEARSAAHNLLNDVLEKMPVGFVAVDRHFHILRANNLAYKLFDHNREDLIGQHIDVLIPTEYRAHHEKFMQTFAAGDAQSLLMDSRREVYGLRADGAVFPIMASVLKMHLGEFPLYCVMIIDLTQIRAAEQRLIETELGIQQMQKQEALGQLAGNIAHDFNNLMAIVLGYADIIQEKKDLPETMQQMVAEIKKAVQRGAALTKQILAYAKHQALDVKRVDMHELLLENRTMLQAALTTGVSLRFSMNAEMRCAEIDENQFMQVLLNLAVNARDAMPSGGDFTVSTRTIRLDDDFFAGRGLASQNGDYLYLTLADTGHGIPQDIVSRIFDPYFSTKPRDKGTGLGLSVAYGIIKQHKGFIFCDSKPGTGTIFEILLPLSQDVRDKGKTEKLTGDLSMLKEKYAEVTVLVVDDEDALRAMIVTVLRGAGFIVHEASNGRRALDLIDTFPGKIDIILSNIMMPEMNGLEMADEARLLQPEAAFIFISGYSKELLMSKQPDQNFRLLIKPFQRHALFAEIHHALRARLGAAADSVSGDEFFI